MLAPFVLSEKQTVPVIVAVEVVLAISMLACFAVSQLIVAFVDVATNSHRIADALERKLGVTTPPPTRP